MAELGLTWERDELGGGKYRHVQHIKPIAYQRNGVWRRMTNVLAASGDLALPVGVDELCQVRLRDRLSGNAPVVHFGKGQSMVRFRPLGTANAQGRPDGANGWLYPEAWPNADLRLILGGHFLRKEVVLRRGHPAAFSFRIDAHAGLNEDKLATPEFFLLNPTLERDGEAVGLVWEKSRQGGKLILTARLPQGDWAGWTLDPTLTLQPDAAAGKDTYLAAGAAADTNYGLVQTLRVYSILRGLVQFVLTGVPSGATINAATFSLWTASAYGAGKLITVRRILAENSAWTETGATYNHAVHDTIDWAGGHGSGCSVVGTDVSSVANTLVQIAGAFTEQPISIATSEMALMVANNAGFCISSASTDDRGAFCPSDHATAAYRPKLVIEYTLPGGLLLRANKTGNKGAWMLGGKQA